MNWELIFKLGIGILGVITATLVFISKRKESRENKLEAKAREAGLAANPERCLRHEERMTKIETLAVGNLNTAAANFGAVKDRLDVIGDDVKTLIKLHLKG